MNEGNHHMNSIRPILVTGSHRSGSTWVGHMLSATPRVGYIHEPFSLICPPGVCAYRFPHWFTYVSEQNEDDVRNALSNTLLFRYAYLAEIRHALATGTGDWRRLKRQGTAFRRLRRSGARALMKDPIALFSSEWLARTFDMDVVILIRHPVAFVSSIKKLNWTHPFGDFTAQPLMMERQLHPFAEEIERAAHTPPSVVDQAILLWNIIHHVIAGYRERHPEWSFARHEDLSIAPTTGFEALYKGIGEPFTDAARSVVEAHTSEQNPGDVNHAHDICRDSKANLYNWRKRLTEEECSRILEGTSAVARYFYSDEELSGS